MEKRGQVNQYDPYKVFGVKPVYTINLSDGTTPFIQFFNGVEFASRCYRLDKPVLVTITHGWYRPTRTVFDALDVSSQDHVLNGGLLCDPLAEAVAKQIPDDSTRDKTAYETFQAWALTVYGRKLKPLETPPGAK